MEGSPRTRSRWSRIAAPLARITAIVVAFMLVTILVVTRSQAAFTDTTSNDGNTFSTGTVSLRDDDANAAMFSASGMAPGTPLQHCIAVTYDGSMLPTEPIALYGNASGSGLNNYLDLTIEEGSGGSFADCSGFTATGTLFSGTLAGYTALHSDYASGLQTWQPDASPQTRTFRFTVDVKDDDNAQGKDATATFTWEARAS